MTSSNTLEYPESNTIVKMIEENKLNDAIVILEKTYEKDSRSTKVWNDLGVLYFKAGKVTDAIDALCRALELNSSNEDAFKNLREIENSVKHAKPTNSDSNVPHPPTLDRNELLKRNNLIKTKIAKPETFLNLNTIYFHITDFCIYKCKQCGILKEWANEGSKRRYMSYSKFVSYFNKFVSGIEIIENTFGFKYLRDKIIIHTQGGGEPLIHPQFSEIINYITDYGFSVKLTTNGALLYGERADALFNANLNELHVSIDAATPEVYADVRQEGQFEKVVNNVQEFISRYQGKEKRPIFTVSFFNAPHNNKDLKQFCEYWAPKVDAVWIQKYIDHINGENSNVDSESDNLVPTKRVFCNRLPGFFMINENGSVIGCQCGNYVAGNLEEQSFEEIMLSEKRINMFEFQEKGFFDKIDECRNCSKWADKIASSDPVIISINNKAYYAQKSNSSLHIRNVYGLDITTLDNESIFV